MDEPRPEQKLRITLDEMRQTLSQESGPPQLKAFWELRKICIPLFQGGVHPAVRSQLWKELSELSREARQLKQMLTKEVAIAADEIENTIETLEMRVANLDGEASQYDILLPQFPSLEPVQQKLHVLNTAAANINALRKELIDTQVRFKQKNQLFSRLSKLGDQVFPKRKELIGELSREFGKLVDAYTSRSRKSRADVQRLQEAAKQLTINSEVFSRSREQLNRCWNGLQGREESRKNNQRAEAEAKQASWEAEMRWIEEAPKEDLVAKQQEIEAEIEALCKAKAGSGFDFEQALGFEAQIAHDRARVSAIETRLGGK